MENLPTPRADRIRKVLDEQPDISQKARNIFEAIIDEIAEMEIEVAEQSMRVAEIDEDLADVEEEIYEEFEPSEFLGGLDLGFDEFEDNEVFELECPHCQMKLYIDEGVLEQAKMNCPSCGKEVTFDLDDINDMGGGGDNGDKLDGDGGLGGGCSGGCGTCGGCH